METKNNEKKKYSDNPLYIKQRIYGKKDLRVWSLQRINDHFGGKRFIRAIRKGEWLKQDIFTFGRLERIPELMESHNEKFHNDEDVLLLTSEDGSQRYIMEVERLPQLLALCVFSMGGFRGEQPSATFFPICTSEESNITFSLCVGRYFDHYEELDEKEKLHAASPEVKRERERKREEKREAMRKAFKGEEPIVGQFFKSYLDHKVVVRREGDRVLAVGARVESREWTEEKSYWLNMSWEPIPFFIECCEPSTREEFAAQFKETADEILNHVTPILGL